MYRFPSLSDSTGEGFVWFRGPYANVFFLPFPLPPPVHFIHLTNTE